MNTDHNPLILYRKSTDFPGRPTRLSDIPEEQRAFLLHAVGEVKTCISCQHCRLDSGVRSLYRCEHPHSVDKVTGRSLDCDLMRRDRPRHLRCGAGGDLWEPITGSF
ncbi:hypothetical protein [Pseudomonas aeruginosa]|uniref:hypothetical protein n=1 Tax=Pseudomonas aeruginosa TaxID=287 RepID=UPI0012987E84|nr:hypothetical protein [Pseudomonas aeruginosa]MEB6159121.1 hypothetical protein [Pseudomonas aeruginosa]HBO2319977.1 hypothetical protein [Pseudomonas aeruginosa]